jgi:hypothetical protein
VIAHNEILVIHHMLRFPPCTLICSIDLGLRSSQPASKQAARRQATSKQGQQQAGAAAALVFH